MGVLLVVARFALAAVFIVAGLAKLLDARGSRKSLGDFGVPGALIPVTAVLLPLSELGCAIAMFLDGWAVRGALGAAVLLAVFIVGIAVSLARGRAPACHCFGQLSSSAVSRLTLARNFALLLLAIGVIWGAGQDPSALPAPFENPFQTAMVVATGILAAVLALIVWFQFHMLQQYGRLLLRLAAVEKRLNIDPNREPVHGLPVGDPAPPFELGALEGGTMSLKKLREAGKPILLIFTEPNCSACEALRLEVALWQSEYAEQMTIVPVSRGEKELNRTKSMVGGLRNVLLQADREVAQAYQVTATPSAVLVVGGQIASQIASGADAVRALVARRALPPPVKKGDSVPSLKLRDLNGKMMDLADMRGRRTLLLFWSPSCGFCQKILPYLRSWSRPVGAPELVVVASGSPEDNRKQGLRARVLLDPSFSSGHVFGATGTPSALVLDEEGRIASEVGAGAPAVFALAGVKVPAGWS